MAFFHSFSNRKLRNIPYPLHDIMVAAKAGMEKVDVLWKQIQESLQRNVTAAPASSKSGTTALTARSQPHVSLSSTHQLLERLVRQINEAFEHIQRQSGSEETTNAQVDAARGVLDDALGAKQLLSSLLANVDATLQEDVSLNSTLQTMVTDVQAVLTAHLQTVGANLIGCAAAHCAGVMSLSSSLTEQLKKAAG